MLLERICVEDQVSQRNDVFADGDALQSPNDIFPANILLENDGSRGVEGDLRDRGGEWRTRSLFIRRLSKMKLGLMTDKQ